MTPYVRLRKLRRFKPRKTLLKLRIVQVIRRLHKQIKARRKKVAKAAEDSAGQKTVDTASQTSGVSKTPEVLKPLEVAVEVLKTKETSTTAKRKQAPETSKNQTMPRNEKMPKTSPSTVAIQTKSSGPVEVSTNDIKPLRFGLNFQPASLIVEYQVVSKQILCHHKIAIPPTALEKTISEDSRHQITRRNSKPRLPSSPSSPSTDSTVIREKQRDELKPLFKYLLKTHAPFVTKGHKDQILTLLQQLRAKVCAEDKALKQGGREGGIVADVTENEELSARNSGSLPSPKLLGNQNIVERKDSVDEIAEQITSRKNTKEALVDSPAQSPAFSNAGALSNSGMVPGSSGITLASPTSPLDVRTGSNLGISACGNLFEKSISTSSTGKKIPSNVSDTMVSPITGNAIKDPMFALKSPKGIQASKANTMENSMEASITSMLNAELGMKNMATGLNPAGLNPSGSNPAGMNPDLLQTTMPTQNPSDETQETQLEAFELTMSEDDEVIEIGRRAKQEANSKNSRQQDERGGPETTTAAGPRTDSPGSQGLSNQGLSKSYDSPQSPSSLGNSTGSRRASRTRENLKKVQSREEDELDELLLSPTLKDPLMGSGQRDPLENSQNDPLAASFRSQDPLAGSIKNHSDTFNIDGMNTFQIGGSTGPLGVGGLATQNDPFDLAGLGRFNSGRLNSNNNNVKNNNNKNSFDKNGFGDTRAVFGFASPQKLDTLDNVNDFPEEISEELSYEEDFDEENESPIAKQDVDRKASPGSDLSGGFSLGEKFNPESKKTSVTQSSSGPIPTGIYTLYTMPPSMNSDLASMRMEPPFCTKISNGIAGVQACIQALVMYVICHKMREKPSRLWKNTPKRSMPDLQQKILRNAVTVCLQGISKMFKLSSGINYASYTTLESIPRNFDVEQLVISAILSYGIEETQAALGEKGTLTTFSGSASQALINLLIAGEPVSNCFDGNRGDNQLGGSSLLSSIADGSRDDNGKSRGISRRSKIGFLTVEQEVGDYLKNPASSVFVLQESQSEFSVLYSEDDVIRQRDDQTSDDDASVASGGEVELQYIKCYGSDEDEDDKKRCKSVSVKPNHLLRAPAPGIDSAQERVNRLIRLKYGELTGISWLMDDDEDGW